VIFVFQSVPLLSKRHTSLPPLEIVVQGRFVPGMYETRHPCGKGTWHVCPVGPFAMAKLQDSSVVAPGSSIGCAAASSRAMLSTAGRERKKLSASHRATIVHTMVAQVFALRPWEGPRRITR